MEPIRMPVLSTVTLSLCYATKLRPTEGFEVGGVLSATHNRTSSNHAEDDKINNRNCTGNRPRPALNNIHGSYYVFYHRHKSDPARHCAERITSARMAMYQAETTCGLNDGPLRERKLSFHIGLQRRWRQKGTRFCGMIK